MSIPSFGKRAHISVLAQPIGSRTFANSMTPYKILWYNVKPSIAHMCIYGSSAYVHILEELRRKLDKMNKHYIFMGNNQMNKAFCPWDN